MNKEINELFYKKLPDDKIKINWNEKPIKMTDFLGFLAVTVERSYGHFGSDTGWTLLHNKEHKLKISGGIVGGVEYLNSLQYGCNLANPYNNYVNPFYLFDILTKEGQQFFLEYYNEDIQSVVQKAKNAIDHAERQLARSKECYDLIEKEIERLKNNILPATQPH